MNEHLGEHKLPNQENKSMEEPEEVRAGAWSPSPEYEDPMEAKALMEEFKEAGAGARSPSLKYVAPGSQAKVRSPSRSRTEKSRGQIHAGQ